MEDGSIEDVAGRLRRNETGYSCLDLKMNPGFEARDIRLLSEAVLANQTLKEVNFFGILGDNDINEETRRLVESFATLPKLERLQMFGYCEDALATLNHVLHHRAQTLKDLRITYVHLDGSDDAATHFQQNLQNLTCLEAFNLVDCVFSERLRDTTLDRTLMGLSKLPNLKQIGIQPLETDALGCIKTDHLVEVCRLPKLSYLSIVGLPFPNTFPHLGKMMLALRHTCSIQELIFQSSTSDDNCASIAELIRGAKKLKFMHVRLSAEGEQDARHIVRIGEALRENASVKTLTIEYRHSSNSSIDPTILAEFGDLLDNNYSLENITFLSNATPGIQVDPLVSMYLRLNKMGRGVLLKGGQSKRQQWVEMILESRDYLDGIFYFLSMNPLLCDVSQPS